MISGLWLQVQQEGFSVSEVTVLIIIALILLLLTAIVSGAETAFFSLRPKDIHYLKTRDQGNARQAVALLDQPRSLLATIIVAVNVINIAIIVTIHLLVDRLMEGTDAAGGAILPLVIKILVITFLLVMFGTVLPKVYATQQNTRMALFAAPLLSMLSFLFRPVSNMLVSSTSYIEERLSTSPDSFSTEDFEQAIERTMGHPARREEVNIFKGIMKFGDITVRQIMRTRLDVAGVPYSLGFAEVKQFAMDSGYSRMPVYRENLDTIAGIIHSKDFLPHQEDSGFDWHNLIRPAYFVHEGKLIEHLLHEFQQKRIHMAVVVDEFGGTSGIVTLEDIMEEIIGDIRDEFDEDEINYRKLDEHNYIFDGKIMINDACRIMGISTGSFDNVRGGSDSLAGLLLEINGRFPSVNETIFWRHYEFTVLETDRTRITRIKLTLQESEDEDNDRS